MDSEEIMKLKTFVGLCKANPAILHAPQFAFFKEYLDSLGATVPPPSQKTAWEAPEEEKPTPEPTPSPAPAPAEPEPEPESSGSELDISDTGVIEDDDVTPQQPMGDPDKVVTDDMMEEASVKRNEAMEALNMGNPDQAILLFTDAIILNPKSAVLFAKRACAYVRELKPKRAILDCDQAIELNPDSAIPYKWRGKANKLLGQWVNAARDLRMAAKLDFDDDINQLLHEVEPKAKKIELHLLKKERKKKERQDRERRERIQKAREEREKAQKEYERQQAEQESQGFPGGMPGFGGMGGGMPGGMGGGMPGGMGGMPGGGMPGMGGMPGGMGGLGDLLNDPELLMAFQDPEVMAAFKVVSQDPSKISEYENNPKVKRVIEKMTAKFGAAGAGGPGEGGMPGGSGSPPFGGPGAGGSSSFTPSSADID
ncbi:hsc70-interacting protein-like [Lineus longissimus]|uniref:hsc70-interacting protein-like n=1 Tax=Lineus longissimus TaxID=88925 RepID=UPI002B4F5E6D